MRYGRCIENCRQLSRRSSPDRPNDRTPMLLDAAWPEKPWSATLRIVRRNATLRMMVTMSELAVAKSYDPELSQNSPRVEGTRHAATPRH